MHCRDGRRNVISSTTRQAQNCRELNKIAGLWASYKVTQRANRNTGSFPGAFRLPHGTGNFEGRTVLQPAAQGRAGDGKRCGAWAGPGCSSCFLGSCVGSNAPEEPAASGSHPGWCTGGRCYEGDAAETEAASARLWERAGQCGTPFLFLFYLCLRCI